jgi:succinate-semialdehyde dehydrogenase/glutarate-semialdehyde dehydrogenase
VNSALASDGGTSDVHDPSTGLVLLSIADATPADGAAAPAAADEAQRGWSG